MEGGGRTPPMLSNYILHLIILITQFLLRNLCILQIKQNKDRVFFFSLSG
jgi:hypothetical protein